MKYQVWRVFENEGTRSVFYIVNIETKAIQSVWPTWIGAEKTCRDLNSKVA